MNVQVLTHIDVFSSLCSGVFGLIVKAALPDQLQISASTKDKNYDHGPILPPAPAPLLHDEGDLATASATFSSTSFNSLSSPKLAPSGVSPDNSRLHDNRRRYHVPGVLYSSVALLQPNEATHLHLLSTLEQMVKEHRTMSSKSSNHGPIGDQDVMIQAFLGNISCLPPRWPNK